MISMRNLILLVLGLAILIALPQVVTSSFAIDIFIRILLFSFIGVAWNLMGGYAKQLSLGHAAYFGLGAYTSTILQIDFGISPWIGMVAGGVVAMLASLPIGWLCFRLRGPYFTIATIATAQALMLIFLKFRDFAWGAEGTTIPNLGSAPLMMQFESKPSYYYVVLGLLALGLLITWLIERSWMGYYLVAIGEDEDAAEAIGVNAPQDEARHLHDQRIPDCARRYVLHPIHLLHRSCDCLQLQHLDRGRAGIDRRRHRHAVGTGDRHRAAGDHIGPAAELARQFDRRHPAHRLRTDPDGRHPVAAHRTDRRRDRGVSALRAPPPGARVRTHKMAEALVIKGLSKRFGGLRAVQDVSFSVQENETLALIGPNGAGKTTSFHLMTGFHRPDSGSVMAFGRDIVGLKPHDICALGLARTFQVAKPFGAMTVLANVMTGAFLRDRHVAAARVKALEAIEFVGLAAREQTAAKDLTTIDQRRLEMARALATEPKILLLDEVMAGLNPAEIDQAVALVKKLASRGLTIVIVEHVMRAIMAVAKHIVVLDHGQKIAEGSPKEIVENPEVIRAYLGSYVHTPPAGDVHA